MATHVRGSDEPGRGDVPDISHAVVVEPHLRAETLKQRFGPPADLSRRQRFAGLRAPVGVEAAFERDRDDPVAVGDGAVVTLDLERHSGDTRAVGCDQPLRDQIQGILDLPSEYPSS